MSNEIAAPSCRKVQTRRNKHFFFFYILHYDHVETVKLKISKEKKNSEEKKNREEDVILFLAFQSELQRKRDFKKEQYNDNRGDEMY